MRTVILALLLSTPSLALAADRSFTVDGHRYELDFPSEFAFILKKKIVDSEYVLFRSDTTSITMGHLYKGEAPTEFKSLIIKNGGKGFIYFRIISYDDFAFSGGCRPKDVEYAHSKTLRCFYEIFKYFSSTDSILYVGVSCWGKSECTDSVIRDTSELADNLAEQLRSF